MVSICIIFNVIFTISFKMCFYWISVCVWKHLGLCVFLVLFPWLLFSCFCSSIVLFKSVWFLSFQFYYYSLDVCWLSNEKQKALDLDGRGSSREIGGVWGEETIIKLYWRKTIIFNKRKIEKCVMDITTFQMSLMLLFFLLNT